MSVLEIWGAEYQENDALLIRPADRELLQGICARERCGMQARRGAPCWAPCPGWVPWLCPGCAGCLGLARGGVFGAGCALAAQPTVLPSHDVLLMSASPLFLPILRRSSARSTAAGAWCCATPPRRPALSRRWTWTWALCWETCPPRPSGAGMKSMHVKTEESRRNGIKGSCQRRSHLVGRGGDAPAGRRAGSKGPQESSHPGGLLVMYTERLPSCSSATPFAPSCRTRDVNHSCLPCPACCAASTGRARRWSR